MEHKIPYGSTDIYIPLRGNMLLGIHQYVNGEGIMVDLFDEDKPGSVSVIRKEIVSDEFLNVMTQIMKYIFQKEEEKDNAECKAA